MNRHIEIDYHLGVTSVSLFIFPLLYIFRFLDDNTLTRWAWVFNSSNYGWLILSAGISVFVAYIICRISAEKYIRAQYLFLISFISALFFLSEPEVIIDTGRYFTQAKYLELEGVRYFLSQWGKGIDVWTDLPAIPFIYGLIFRYLGEDRIFIQLFNTGVFALTPVLIFYIGRKIWSEDVGICSALMLLSIPYLYVNVPLMLVDVPTMFFVALALFFFLVAVEKGGALLEFISAVSLFIMMLCKYSTWLLIPIFPLIILRNHGKGLSSYVRRMLLIGLYLILLLIVVFIMKRDVFIEQIRLLSSFQWQGLKRWHEGILSTFFFQIHPFFTISMIMGVLAGILNRDRRIVFLLWPVVYIFVFHAMRARYLIPLFPLFSLLAGYGLRALVKESKKMRFIVYISSITSFIISLFFYLPFINGISMANLKDASAILQHIKSDRNKIYVTALPQGRSTGNTWAVVPILDLYTGKEIILRDFESVEPGHSAMNSSLRFTWRWSPPLFYKLDEDRDKLPIVIIADNIYACRESLRRAPEGYRIQVLDKFRRVFRFRTFVTILIPEQGMSQIGQSYSLLMADSGQSMIEIP